MEGIWTIVVSASVGALVALLTQFAGHRYWLRQETWKLRGDAYRQLFAALSGMRRFLTFPPQESDDARTQLADKAGEVFAAAEFARIFMADDGRRVLDRFEREVARGVANPSDLDMLALFNTFIRYELPGVARRDFGLEPAWWRRLLQRPERQ